MKKHFAYYLSLLVILGTGFSAFYFSPDRSFQMLIFTLTVLFYVIWGIFHHYLHHDLTAKIVVEYTLMGAIGEAVVFLIFKGGFGL